ncbi:Dps family protein [Ekhidna sp. To15]|uniref:Dps family protein n=1 Tax=Ekhidna sp. To15 TaxID=3395267 RepID=UPI003F524AFB
MSTQLISELNQLLSDFHVYYQNTRGAHWNIKGPRFFELHNKFEELYTEALTNIDEIAERILTIGGRPHHALETYLEHSNIKSVKDVSKDEILVEMIVDNLNTLIGQENKVKEMAVEAGDNETEDMMIGLVNVQEKTLWMFNSWLDK